MPDLSPECALKWTTANAVDLRARRAGLAEVDTLENFLFYCRKRQSKLLLRLTQFSLHVGVNQYGLTSALGSTANVRDLRDLGLVILSSIRLIEEMGL